MYIYNQIFTGESDTTVGQQDDIQRGYLNAEQKRARVNYSAPSLSITSLSVLSP